MKCKHKISDEIYYFKYRDNNVICLYNDNDFKILLSKPMFEKYYEIDDNDNNDK